jgi:alanine dehydrogenase
MLGGGVSGTHAAEMAVGLRADVTVVDRSVKRCASCPRSSAAS